MDPEKMAAAEETEPCGQGVNQIRQEWQKGIFYRNKEIDLIGSIKQKEVPGKMLKGGNPGIFLLWEGFGKGVSGCLKKGDKRKIKIQPGFFPAV